MANHLKKYTTRAKKLQEDHPNMKWQSLVKMAAKEINDERAHPKKRHSRKKKAAKKSASKKHFFHPSKKHHTATVAGVQRNIPTRIGHEVAEKLKCQEMIADLQHKLRHAPGLNEKRDIRRAIEYYRKCAKTAKANIANLKKLL